MPGSVSSRQPTVRPSQRVDVPHPLRVAAGQVVVDRDQVRAAAGERVEVERQRRDQRLAFAGGHLGDLALVQHDAADELHVVGHHVPGQLVPGDHDRRPHQAAAGLPHGGERLRQELVELRRPAPSSSWPRACGSDLQAVPLLGIGDRRAWLRGPRPARGGGRRHARSSRSRKRAVWPRISASDRPLSRSSWRWMSATSGRIFFISRSYRVPRTAVISLLIMPLSSGTARAR